MTEHFQSQGAVLVKGVNAFEPFIYRLHSDFKDEKFIDWPTIVLATTLQATAISTFRLLPTVECSNEILDQRSIASLIRNIIETHDVLRMMVKVDSEDRFNLNRDIMGLYISSRVNKIQTALDGENVQAQYVHAKKWYWRRIKKSPLYTNKMARLKDGESIFYESRRSRVEAVCGQHSDFVMGVLADLSTYVHSIPAPIWFSNLDDIYTDKQSNRDIIAVWLRVANFYIAKSYEIVLSVASYDTSTELSIFLERHGEVFN